jgi:peptidoglycan/LPS O-acetylase OafA/YrhL
MHAPMAPTAVRTSYRPDIDGLRAVAVLSVLYFHYGVPLPAEWQLSGGFAGVDVFFVISGFLITSKLRDDIADGRFSVLGFYDRRVRRILPALLVMLGATLLAGNFLLAPSDYKALADSAAAAAFGVSNLYFLSNTGYFDLTAELLPLLHTWSLAVEEQFYVVWPFLLFLIVKGRRRSRIATILACVTLLGFVASLVWFGQNQKSAFYWMPPRAWELALGATLVFLHPLKGAIGRAAPALGLVLLGAGFLLLSPASFPGFAALCPCAGAALIIWPRRDTSRATQWLGWLSPVGLISYSLYLWHWPIWVMFRIYSNNAKPEISEAAALAAVSILVSTLSYLLIERPLRKQRLTPGRSVSAGLAASLLISGAAFTIHRNDGLPSRVPPEVYATRNLAAMWAWPCQEMSIFPTGPFYCVFGTPWIDGVEKAILWGDSSAQHLAPLLEPSASRAHVAVGLYATCPAILGGNVLRLKAEPGYNRQCENYRTAMFGLLEQRPEIRTVILSASWPPLVELLKGANELSYETNQEKLFEIALTEVVDRISALGRQVVVVATVPRWDHWYVPCALYGDLLFRRPCGEQQLSLKKSFYLEVQAESLRVFRRVAEKRPAVRLIVPGDGLCAEETCITSLGGDELYRDIVHIRRNLRSDTNRALAQRIGLDSIFAGP